MMIRNVRTLVQSGNKSFSCTPKVFTCKQCIFNTSSTKSDIAEFANSVDPDEVAHHEPPHVDLYCLHSIV